MIGVTMPGRLGLEEELQRPTAQEREPVSQFLQQLSQQPELVQHAQRGIEQQGQKPLSQQCVLTPERRLPAPVRGQQAGGAALPVARQRPPQDSFIVATAPALLQQPAAPAWRWRRLAQNPSYQQQVLFQLSHLVGRNQYRIHVDASKRWDAQLVSNQTPCRKT